jgi:hypothetical protein
MSSSAFKPAQAQLTTSYAAIYTCPRGKTARINSMIICNTSAAGVSVKVAAVPKGGTAGTTNQILDAATIIGIGLSSFYSAPGGLVVIEEGGSLQAQAGANTALTLTLAIEEWSV